MPIATSMKKLEKPVTVIFPSFCSSARTHEAQRVSLTQKMRQHHKEGYRRANGRGKSRAANAHIAREDEKPVAEHIENAARQHSDRRKRGRAVVAQKRCEHLIEEKQREHGLDRRHIPLREDKERLVRAEKCQKRALKEKQADPRKGRQKHRADDRGGEITGCPRRRRSCRCRALC